LAPTRLPEEIASCPYSARFDFAPWQTLTADASKSWRLAASAIWRHTRSCRMRRDLDPPRVLQARRKEVHLRRPHNRSPERFRISSNFGPLFLAPLTLPRHVITITRSRGCTHRSRFTNKTENWLRRSTGRPCQHWSDAPLSLSAGAKPADARAQSISRFGVAVASRVPLLGSIYRSFPSRSRS
jgi:hypothetical protein